jgi:hypothetical protein
VDGNRAPQDTEEHNVALKSKQSENPPNAAGVSMGQIEDILRKLLDEERSKDRERERERSRLEHDPRYLLRELQAANERNQRQELALREKDDALRRMREDLPRYHTNYDSRSGVREEGESCIRPSDPRDYGKPRALGGGYREAAARASARANERESRAHCLSTGKDFGVTAVMGDAKFNIALPPKFNPEKDAWMLWKPQVFSYFDMINLEGILESDSEDMYSLQENKYVIGALQQISPPTDAAWMSSLQLKWAYQAWEQLEKAYGSRSELDMQ